MKEGKTMLNLNQNDSKNVDMVIETRKDLLDKFTTDVSNLNDFWNHPKEERKALVDWCINAFLPSDELLKNRTSYGLKHTFEHAPKGFYSSNDEFKAAMLLAGWIPDNPDDLNWEYYIYKYSAGVVGYKHFKMLVAPLGIEPHSLKNQGTWFNEVYEIWKDTKSDDSFGSWLRSEYDNYDLSPIGPKFYEF